MDDRKINIASNGRKAAYGGIVASLSLLCLYISASGIVPFNRLSFYALSTMFIFIMQIEFGLSSAFATFGATSLLAVIIVPNKAMLVPHILFFGYYGIIKYYIERISNLFLEWLLKIVAFMGAMYITYLIVVKLFSLELSLPYGIPGILIIVVGIGIFAVYDLAYSIIIGYYNRKRRKLLG
jgi:hypothetical protein